IGGVCSLGANTFNVGSFSSLLLYCSSIVGTGLATTSRVCKQCPVDGRAEAQDGTASPAVYYVSSNAVYAAIFSFPRSRLWVFQKNYSRIWNLRIGKNDDSFIICRSKRSNPLS